MGGVHATGVHTSHHHLHNHRHHHRDDDDRTTGVCVDQRAASDLPPLHRDLYHVW